MKLQMSSNGVFSRHVSLEPIEALKGQYSLQFDSSLSSAKDPQAIKRNFQAILQREDVVALRNMLDATLELSARRT